MPTEKSLQGTDDDYYFGPSNLYIRTTPGFIASGPGATGTGLYLGRTGPIEVKPSNTYAEQTSIQTGASADDHALSGQSFEFTTTLKEAGKTRVAATADGFSHNSDSLETYGQLGYVNQIGKRGRANSFRMTQVAYEGGVERWDDPDLIWDYFVTCPMTADPTINFDAENFREFAIMFRIYESRTEVDYLNRPAYFLSRAS